EDGIRDGHVTGVQTCALPILGCDVATPGVDFGAVPGTGRCDLSNLVAGEIVEVVHARAAGGLADALTVGIVDVAGGRRRAATERAVHLNDAVFGVVEVGVGADTCSIVVKLPATSYPRPVTPVMWLFASKPS